jgi:hypothetical protein
MEPVQILPPQTVWEPSVVMEEQIQALAPRRLLRPKMKVGWRPAVGEEFPTEGTGETVAFLAHIERGFGVLAGDFFCGLLFFYRIELVHLVPNAITIISSFIHLCEAYLGIEPHFHLWCNFFELKKIGKSEVVGSVGFMLRRYMKPKYIDLVFPDNTNSWKQGCFYLDNPVPALPDRTRRAPAPFPEWTNQLTSQETEELRPLLEDLERFNAEGLTDGAVAISFSRRLIQPIQDQVQRTYEYWGQSNPTRVIKHKVSKRGDGGAGEGHLRWAHPQP